MQQNDGEKIILNTICMDLSFYKISLSTLGANIEGYDVRKTNTGKVKGTGVVHYGYITYLWPKYMTFRAMYLFE